MCVKSVEMGKTFTDGQVSLKETKSSQEQLGFFKHFTEGL